MRKLLCLFLFCLLSLHLQSQSILGHWVKTTKLRTCEKFIDCSTLEDSIVFFSNGTFLYPYHHRPDTSFPESPYVNVLRYGIYKGTWKFSVRKKKDSLLILHVDSSWHPEQGFRTSWYYNPEKYQITSMSNSGFCISAVACKKCLIQCMQPSPTFAYIDLWRSKLLQAKQTTEAKERQMKSLDSAEKLIYVQHPKKSKRQHSLYGSIVDFTLKADSTKPFHGATYHHLLGTIVDFNDQQVYLKIDHENSSSSSVDISINYTNQEDTFRYINWSHVQQMTYASKRREIWTAVSGAIATASISTFYLAAYLSYNFKNNTFNQQRWIDLQIYSASIGTASILALSGVSGGSFIRIPGTAISENWILKKRP